MTSREIASGIIPELLDKNGYSKRLLGRLHNIYNTTQLTLVGGGFNGQKARAHHFTPHFPSLSVLKDLEGAHFNARFPQVARSLIPEGGSYIEGIGGEDFHNLPQIAADFATKVETSSVIRVVYGATSRMPLRALSYILPSLNIMENIAQAGVNPPQLQVIFANNISARLDRMDASTATAQTRRFAQVAQAYIGEFFPVLKDRTVFLEDTPLDKGSDLRDRLLYVTKILRSITPADILEDLTRKAASNGAARTYEFYGAAHILIHDMDIPGSLAPVLPEQPEIESEPDTIISMGGKQEEIFYRLRHAVKPHLDPEYRRIRTLQFFSRHHVPPYYMARGGDVSMDQVLHDGLAYRDIARAARFDLEYLE